MAPTPTNQIHLLLVCQSFRKMEEIQHHLVVRSFQHFKITMETLYFIV